jgi:hypothetical protein
MSLCSQTTSLFERSALLVTLSNVSSSFCNFTRLIIFLVPPHGTEEIEVLESIFEMDHLRSSALFLDTQCKLI